MSRGVLVSYWVGFSLGVEGGLIAHICRWAI